MSPGVCLGFLFKFLSHSLLLFLFVVWLCSVFALSVWCVSPATLYQSLGRLWSGLSGCVLPGSSWAPSEHSSASPCSMLGVVFILKCNDVPLLVQCFASRLVFVLAASRTRLASSIALLLRSLAQCCVLGYSKRPKFVFKYIFFFFYSA